MLLNSLVCETVPRCRWHTAIRSTPRWTAYDAAYFNVKMADHVPMVTQERAFSSPIWYTPT
jgi:hypothetical protein